MGLMSPAAVPTTGLTWAEYGKLQGRAEQSAEVVPLTRAAKAAGLRSSVRPGGTAMRELPISWSES